MAYAHANLRRFTATRRAERLTRTIRSELAAHLDICYAMQHRGDLVLAGLAFLIALGIVHFPAAIILFVKKRRGSGRS